MRPLHRQECLCHMERGPVGDGPLVVCGGILDWGLARPGFVGATAVDGGDFGAHGAEIGG